MKKLQLIAMDSITSKAVNHIREKVVTKECIKFSELKSIFNPIQKQVILTSELTAEIIQYIGMFFQNKKTAILLFNNDFMKKADKETIKYLLESNCIPIPVPIQNRQMDITLSSTFYEYLENVINILNIDNREENIKVSEKEFNQLFHKKGLCYLYVMTDSSIENVVRQLHHRNEFLLNASNSLLLTFFVPIETPLIQIVKCVELFESFIPLETDYIFQLSTYENEKESIKISLLNCVNNQI